MEDSLRESEASFRELADTAPVMIWTTDTGGLVRSNAGWLRFTGTSVEAELGSSWELGVHPMTSTRCSPRGMRRWPSARAGSTSTGCVRHGDHRWVVDRGVPRYEGGRFAGYVGTAIDIHERKLLEERLREIYQQEHRIAETLQRSLLPERLPEIEDSVWPRAILPAGPGRRSGVTGTTCSSGRTGASRAGRGRRGGTRPARRIDDGSAAQRVPRLRTGRGLARRGGGLASTGW